MKSKIMKAMIISFSMGLLLGVATPTNAHAMENLVVPDQYETLEDSVAPEQPEVPKDGNGNEENIAETYTITFDVGYGYYKYKEIRGNANEWITLPTEFPTFQGETFLIWKYSVKVGDQWEERTIKPGESLRLTCDLTMTAQWERVRYMREVVHDEYEKEVFYPGQDAWLAIQPFEPGMYEFTVKESNLDTMGEIQGRYGTVCRDDDSGEGKAFKIQRYFPACELYVLRTWLKSPEEVGKLTIVVDNIPYITQDPISTELRSGDKASFHVDAIGKEICSYQWYYSTDDAATWKVAGGASAQTDTYEFTVLSNHDNILVRCEVSNSNNRKAVSDCAHLTVQGAIKLTHQPQSTTVFEGNKASFKVATAAENPTYQWYYSMDAGKNWKVATGASATTANYIVTPKSKTTWDGMLVRCMVTDRNGAMVRSNQAKLTVRSATAIIEQPQDASVMVGGKVTFRVKANGENLTYQWKVSANNGSTWITPGAASAKTANYEFTTKLAQNGYLVKCFVTGADGKSVETNAVKLTVKTNVPVITTQPAAQTVAAGAKATFKVVAAGEGLAYQWKVSTNNGTSWTTPTAKAAKTANYSFTTKAAQNGYLVKCVITDANGKKVETNAVKLTVK